MANSKIQIYYFLEPYYHCWYHHITLHQSNNDPNYYEYLVDNHVHSSQIIRPGC